MATSSTSTASNSLSEKSDALVRKLFDALSVDLVQRETAPTWGHRGDIDANLSDLFGKLFDSYLIQTPVCTYYRQRACVLLLGAIYCGMRGAAQLPLRLSDAMATAVMTKVDWREVLREKPQAYAMLRCLFTAESYGAEAHIWADWNRLLTQWLPLSGKPALNNLSTCQEVANTVFDRTWLTLYDIDFNNLNWSQLDRLLCEHPPLATHMYASEYSMASDGAALPTSLFE